MSRVLKSYLVLALITGALSSVAARADEVYGIHLFFDEREFVDVLTLSEVSGRAVGRMDVPNDFSGPVTDLVIDSERLRFNLLVPRNATRPEDMVFHYEARAFDSERKQLIGFVTSPQQPGFVASFVGFRR